MMVQAPPRRISTLELALYSVVVAYTVFELTRGTYVASREFDPGQRHSGAFKTYISWIPHARMDLSDIQWRLYRASLPQLIIALCFYGIPSQLMQYRPDDPSQCHFNPIQHAFRILAAVVFLIGLHGSFALHVLAACLLHYACTKATLKMRTLCPIVAWTVPSAVWLLSRLYDGISFSKFMPALQFLDAYSGPVRWQIGFNLLALRMISWSMDCHWSWMWHKGLIPTKGHSAPLYAYKDPPSQYFGLQLKDRQSLNHSSEWYSMPMYLAYCLYPPLYLTGPTITFNDWVCQLRQPRHPSVMELALYGGRLVLAFCITEALTHTLFCNALTRFRPWERMEPEEASRVFHAFAMASVAFYKLIFIWLKFLVIWRVARLFALVDGIDPPENMLRCVCNNYDITGFWRNWHASFNKWIIRYLYVPLGGQQWRLLNVWVVFTFVALWHDLEWHLLRWAWMMALFLAPEMICKAIINTPKWRAHWNRPWFLHLCAASSAVYIAVMMIVNLVGYGMGQAGVNDLLKRMSESWTTGVGLLFSFFCATHLMFEVRRREKDQKI